MVAYLTKSDASEGFTQIIDFLNGSYLKYALTVNPNIYVSCIKQVWNTVAIKQVNDITRLQAIVDKKKVVVTEAAIKEVLQLDDVEGVDCLPNEEIFTELARMGLAMASAVICLSTGDLSTHTTKYASPTLTQKVFANMRKVRKGLSRVETPLFEGMLVGQEIEEERDADEDVEDVTAGDNTQGDDIAAHGEVPTRVDTSDDTMMDDEYNQGRMIDDMDKDDFFVLMDEKEEDKKVEKAKVDESAQEDEQTKVQEVVDVVTTTKLITKVVTAASEIVTAASAIIFAAEHQVPAAIITAVPAKVAAAPKEPKPLKKKKQIKMDEEYARKLHAEINKDIDWDVAIDHVKLKAKEDPAVQRYQVIKRKPQKEAQARKNMMMYLKNTKEQMEEEENRALQSINETPAQKVAKRRKLNEEVEDIKRHLEIVPDEDDDVYTEATPLTRKVPVMDYEIIELNNKPYYEIIRADRTHQLYISFLILLKNFDREDLEALWSLVKERFHAQTSFAFLHYSPPQDEHHHEDHSDILVDDCISWLDIFVIVVLVQKLGWLELGANAKYVLTCDYDMWKLRIEQYFQVQDYNLWDVIENGNSFKPVPQTIANADGTSTSTILGPVTTEEKALKKNDVKARRMLLMALHNEHLLTFSQYKDAKTLFEAIQARFESLDSIVNKLQKIVSQLAILDLDTISIDDLYNNFKVIEQEVKKTVILISSLGPPNMAFLSFHDITNEADTASIQVSAVNTPVSTVRSPDNTTNLSDATIPRNQDSSRKTVIIKDTSSKAMVAIDGAGFDWSYMADDEVLTNMALMAFSDLEGKKKEEDNTK
nr:hypothetical protein [Tanacetum cinerariifolium]